MHSPVDQSTGPLHGLRVIEIAALGSAPFAAMMLADAGATVLRINRPGHSTAEAGILGRRRTSISLDLKEPSAKERVLTLIEDCDVLIEGFRPGVMERLALGPDQAIERNASLIYARMTGWGQQGPLATTAGHDINYLALTGTLRSIARRGETPVPPLNLVGDYGGGGMLLFGGILTALYERQTSGRGQVIDAAMVDGASLLMSGVWNRVASGDWNSEPGTNSIDSGAPFYNVYRTSDGEYMAVGSIEPQFYSRLLDGLGVREADRPEQHDQSAWETTKNQFSEIFLSQTRDHWSQVFENLDACVSPVLSLEEATNAPHITSRRTLRRIEDHIEPAAAPLFSRTPLLQPDSGPALSPHEDMWIEQFDRHFSGTNTQAHNHNKEVI